MQDSIFKTFQKWIEDTFSVTTGVDVNGHITAKIDNVQYTFRVGPNNRWEVLINPMKHEWIGAISWWIEYKTGFLKKLTPGSRIKIDWQGRRIEVPFYGLILDEYDGIFMIVQLPDEETLRQMHYSFAIAPVSDAATVAGKLDTESNPGTLLPASAYGRHRRIEPDQEYSYKPERCAGDCSRGGDGPPCNKLGCQG